MILDKNSKILINQQSKTKIQGSKKNNSSSNEFLLIVTESIRFQLPQYLKSIEQLIKERKYKISDSIIVKDLVKYFQGSVFTQVNQNFLNNKIKLNQQHILIQKLQVLDELLPYFRIKELIKYSKQTQNSFLQLSKSLLKCVKSLNQKYHEFKSGKIIMSRKSIQNQQMPQNLKNNFIKTKKRKKQDEQDQNFYQIYYFNYQGYGLKQAYDVGINVNLNNVRNQQLQFSPSIKQSNTNIEKNAGSHLQIQEKIKHIRKLSQSIEQNHYQRNKNYQIYKQKDKQTIEIYKQNEQLIKVNTWYEQQLRMHQDKQIQLEGIISQLVNFSKIKQQKLQMKRKDFRIFSAGINIKIQSRRQNQGIRNNLNSSKSSQKFDQIIGLRTSNNHLNRLSKDSNDLIQTRSRKKTNAHLRLINDLNKLTSHTIQKGTSQFILPPPPPPPIFLNQNSLIQQKNQISLLPPPPSFILPPPPPLDSSFFLPPIPLLIKIQEQFSKIQEQKVPRIQMKNLAWNMVDVTKIPNSFWQNVQYVIFDEQDLINNFSKTPHTINPTIIATKQKQMEKKSLLKPDRVKNVQIGLRKARLGYKSMHNIQQIFYKYDQNYFDEDIIQCIISLIPTSKQKQQFADLVIKPQQAQYWTLADYFFASITKIQNFQERLKAINFKMSFQVINSEVVDKVNNFIEFFEDLRCDSFLQLFLQHLLTIGNFLNKKTNKANAYGFKLDSIPKTYTLIGQDHQTSLFDYVLKLLYQKNQQIFKLYSNSSSMDPDIQKNIVCLNIIQQDFKMMNSECQNLQQIIIYSRRIDDNSSNYLLPFYIKSQQQLNLIKKLINIAKEKYQQALQFYCQRMQSQAMITFIKEFRKRVKQYLAHSIKKKQVDQQKSRLSNALSMRYSKFSML